MPNIPGIPRLSALGAGREGGARITASCLKEVVLMRSRFRVTLVTLALLVLSTATAYAHTPMLYVEDMRDGTIYLEGGFSDGSSAAGVKIYLVEDAVFKSNTAARDEYLEALFAKSPKERVAYLEKLSSKADVRSNAFKYSDLLPELFEKKLIIFRCQLDQHGELVTRKPNGKYLVVFDAGPGHVVVKKGPALTDAEREQSK